jgi:curved DNA-binding protein CbpA
MNIKYFYDCRTLEEVKRKYKELAMLHHPDRGGNTATMQEINNEYEEVRKNPLFDFSNETAEDQEDFLKYPEIINQIIGLEGLIIELIGSWIWISGNTYPHRGILKQIGFYFAPKKVMWYYRPSEFKSVNRSPKSIDEIRVKYGSDVIESKSKKYSLTN